MAFDPVDIDAGQVVRWLLDAGRRHEAGLEVRATRQYVGHSDARSEIERFGDQESEELSEVTAVGVVEIGPSPKHAGWLLRIRVEDELGSRLPEDESAEAQEEEIDLEAFEADFIRPGRGTIEVTAEVADPAARQRLDRLLSKIREDRHVRRGTSG